MFFHPPLQTGILLKRYKRFLADIRLDDGTEITVHCPNTGSMLSCSAPGSRVGFSFSGNPNRKYPHTLEIVQDNGTWVGVNTARTNDMVADAILDGTVDIFGDVKTLKREVKVSTKSRLDIVVQHDNTTTFIEVKNCSLAADGTAMFPDAVTARGTKHLHELMHLVDLGMQGCIFFLVQRLDADRFAPARHIDPAYGATLTTAASRGVQLVAWQAEVSPAGIQLVRRLPVEL